MGRSASPSGLGVNHRSKPASPLATGPAGAILPAMEGDASTPRPGLVCPFEKMRPSQLNRDDAFYMALAFNLAVDAWRIDEVPIGAIIERGGEIIAAAHNEVERAGDPTAHAEMLAIAQAAVDNLWSDKAGVWRQRIPGLIQRVKDGEFGAVTDLYYAVNNRAG